MTDKVQKIREEVERLYNQSLADEKRQVERGLECSANVSYGKSKACKELLSFINSMQEEPVSEDDRIRKAMIDFFKHEREEGVTVLHYGVSIECMIAWLEKQGEQPKKNDVCNNCDQQSSCVSPCPMKLVEKQGEQKPVEPQQDMLSQEKYSKAVDECVYGEQKSAWSEGDEAMITLLHNIIDHHYSLDIIKKEEQLKLKDWLKSLKERVQPQSQWKPSDEQIKLLREVQQALLGKDCHNRFVIFMHELKRLREEHL